jgi:hypothetical protein
MEGAFLVRHARRENLPQKIRRDVDGMGAPYRGRLQADQGGRHRLRMATYGRILFSEFFTWYLLTSEKDKSTSNKTLS